MDRGELIPSRRAWRYKYGEEAKIFEGDELEQAEKEGWKDSPDLCKEPEKVPAPTGGKPGPKPKEATLYKRPKGEVVEGQEPPKEIMVGFQKFIGAAVIEEALKDGWFKTRDEAADAPPDPATIEV